MIALPIFGAIAAAVLPIRNERFDSLAAWLAITASTLSSVCGFIAVAAMDKMNSEPQLFEEHAWLGAYAIGYEVAIDGFSAISVLLISIVFPLIMIAHWHLSKDRRGIHALYLILQGSFFGMVCSQNLFLMFFFFALTLLPFYFLMSIWGNEEREAAAFRYLVTGALGNAAIFIGLVAIYYGVEPHTLSIKDLLGGRLGAVDYEFFGKGITVSRVAFVFFCLGLCLRVPVWPFHGWFSAFALQAPPAVLVILGGVFIPSVMNLFQRILFSLFPGEVLEFSRTILILGAINFVLGAIGTAAQKNLKSLLSYLTLSQVGIFLIGLGSLDSAGVVGSVFQQFAAGLAYAGFALFAGVIHNRVKHTEYLDEDNEPTLGGAANSAPFLALIAGILVCALIGLPGAGGFVGQSLIAMGSYTIHHWAIVTIVLGIVFLTFTGFAVFKHIFLGAARGGTQKIQDLTGIEKIYLIPIVVGVLFLGVYPKPVLDLIRPTVLTYLSAVR